MEEELARGEKSKEQIEAGLQRTIDVMREAANSRLEESKPSVYGLIGTEARTMYQYTQRALLGQLGATAMAMALSTSEVNASMGRICAAPTAGSAGILPSILMSLQRFEKYSDTQLREALLVAAGIGQFIEDGATFAGAEGGCQAECGSAAAMAAAAAVYLKGGSVRQSLDAASFAIISILGLVCDPVGGMVEFPCNLRNAFGATNALSAADYALAGVSCPVPFDEVVQVMARVGGTLPDTLRETGMGGIAVAPSMCQKCPSCHN